MISSIRNTNVIFNFAESLRAINQTLFKSPCHHLAADRYVIYAGDIGSLESAKVLLSDWKPLSKLKKSLQPIQSDQLFLITLLENVNQLPNNLFKKLLINAQLNYLKHKLADIFHFLETRVSDNKSLIHHDSIKMLVAEVISDIAIVEMMTIEQAANMRASINQISKKLAKLCGGRGFLQGEAIEMLWVFNIVNNVYLN